MRGRWLLLVALLAPACTFEHVSTPTPLGKALKGQLVCRPAETTVKCEEPKP